jgi:hypothetical protein
VRKRLNEPMKSIEIPADIAARFQVSVEPVEDGLKTVPYRRDDD